MRTALALLVLLAAGRAQAAQQFFVPLTIRPHGEDVQANWPEEGEPSYSPSAVVGGGWMGSGAPGLQRAEGPGGFGELIFPADWGSGHIQAAGFVLKGHGDVTPARRRDVTGLAGSFGGHVVWGHYGLVGYLGILGNMSLLTVWQSGQVTLPDGRVRMEPDTATSIAAGFPLGLLYMHQVGNWNFIGGLDVTSYAGGVTAFTYTLGSQGAFASSRRIDPFLSGGAQLGFRYEPWRLEVDLSARAATASGNNEPLTSGAAMLALGIF